MINTNDMADLVRAIDDLAAETGLAPTVREVQQRLALSAPSVAHYRLRKALDQGLVRTGGRGYVTTPKGRRHAYGKPSDRASLESRREKLLQEAAEITEQLEVLA